MSTTTANLATPVAEVTGRSHPLRRATLTSGAIGAIATWAVAAAADAAGVPLAIDGEAIPMIGFAQMTAIGAVLGGLIAAGLNRYAAGPRRAFAVVTAVLTGASCVPSVALPPDVATKIVLVATHVIAAAIIVPTLVRHTNR